MRLAMVLMAAIAIVASGCSSDDPETSGGEGSDDGYSTIRVPEDRPSLTSAVASARAGDEIVLAPGRFSPSRTRESFPIRLSGKSLRIRGAGAQFTVLDAEGTARHFVISGADRSMLSDLRLTGGKSRETGGAVLIEGGRAELRLVEAPEGGDPLETGIEMVAQPRGKRLQAISLLSGGEKALTGLALLFAIFYFRPSPFCLLDEVDAPLDDANIHRFTRVLRELSSQTQFIVITHNRKTMEAADVLYGVTMEEPGLSRIVSVNLG